jgi:hypothetical protein
MPLFGKLFLSVENEERRKKEEEKFRQRSKNFFNEKNKKMWMSIFHVYVLLSLLCSAACIQTTLASPPYGNILDFCFR